MKKYAIVMLAVLLAACANKPIYNVNDSLPPQAQKLPLERVETVIIEAGQTRGWKFDRIGNGHLLARQEDLKFSATVDIFFDAKTYRIVYKSSTGLKAKDDGTIHERYNTWIRNLEHDIDAHLTNAGTMAH